jgi:hypothetical protein
MNTMPEFLALHRRGYVRDIWREELDHDVQAIREELGLTTLQSCANMFKHVRRIPRHSSEFTASSDDLGTWAVDGNDLVEVAHKAFATFNGLAELK